RCSFRRLRYLAAFFLFSDDKFQEAQSLCCTGIPVRVNCSSRGEQAVTRLQGYGRLGFLLPDARFGQDVGRDFSWMQMARVHAAWLVLCLVHGHFLVRCVGQDHLQQRGMRDHSLPFLAASRSYREEQSESCHGSSFRERTHDLISLLQLKASIRL